MGNPRAYRARRRLCAGTVLGNLRPHHMEPKMSQPLRHVLLSAMKDEGPFVLEFVAHHRVLGFDAIHIASNDCSDGTDLLLDALAAQGVITHTPNPLKPKDTPQHRGYARMRADLNVDDADWVMVLDADEFLYVNRGAGRIADLTGLAGPEIDLIALNSMNFGTSEDMDWRPGPVTRQFTRRLPTDSPRNGPVKCISRGQGRWGGMHNHHPVTFLPKDRDITYLRGNGQVDHLPADSRIWDHMRFFTADRISHDIGWYNHYPIKSIDSYMVRRDRGRGAVPVESPARMARHTEGYWTRFAVADIDDERIIDRYGAETDAEMARILTLPGVAEAQAETERRYAALIAAIANDPEL